MVYYRYGKIKRVSTDAGRCPVEICNDGDGSGAI